MKKIRLILSRVLFVSLLSLFNIYPLFAQDVPMPTRWACAECGASSPVGTETQHKSWCKYNNNGGNSGAGNTRTGPNIGEQRHNKSATFISKAISSYNAGNYKKSLAYYRKAYWYDPNNENLLQRIKEIKNKIAARNNDKPPVVTVPVKPPAPNAVKEEEFKRALAENQKLTTFKNGLDKQLDLLNQWKKDLQKTQEGFKKISDSASGQIINNVLDFFDVTSVKKIGKTPELISKLEKAIAAAKILNTSTETVLTNYKNKNLSQDDIELVKNTNENLKNIGSIIEESAKLAPEYYKKELELMGKLFQLGGSSSKTILALWQKEFGNATIETMSTTLSLIGNKYPVFKVWFTGEQIVEQTAFTIIAERTAYQLSLDISNNEKAYSHLSQKLMDAQMKIEKNEAVIKKYQAQQRR